jgi:hypothetical protein
VDYGNTFRSGVLFLDATSIVYMNEEIIIACVHYLYVLSTLYFGYLYMRIRILDRSLSGVPPSDWLCRL